MAFVIPGVVENEKLAPRAVAIADPEAGVVGTVVKLNAFSSSDPEGHELTYKWEFVGVPIGSAVVQEGFRQLDDDGALVTFSPDVVGTYIVRLTVSNGLVESTDTREIGIRAIMVPHGQGIVPDGKFIWSYIRDVWQQVEGKEWFETLWSALIQIAGAEMLKLYQTDFNKSIRDIQDLCQRRWQAFQPRLELAEDDCTLYLGNTAAGTGATTENLGLDAKAVILAKDNVAVMRGAVLPNVFNQKLTIGYSRNPANIGDYALVGMNQARNGYQLADKIPDETADRILTGIEFQFNFQSKAWHFGKDAKRLDYAERFSKYPGPAQELIYWEGQGGYTYTKGTAGTAGTAVTAVGASFVTDQVLPGYRIGFGSKLPWQISNWYDIKSVDGENQLTLASTPGNVATGDYCIVRDAMDWNVRVGDVIYYPSGKNAGLYLVTKAAGNYIEVDVAPAGASTDNGDVRASVYRPVPVKITQPDSETTGTFSVPLKNSKGLTDVASGRVILVGGRAFTLLRAVTDVRQEVPLTIVMTNEGDLVSNQKSLPWRVPHTLISTSQNFEELGVSAGDLLLFDVTNNVSQAHAEVRAQVVGVIGNRLGFVLTDEELTPGVLPPVPEGTYKTLATEFGIDRVSSAPDGSLLLTEDAKAIVDFIGTTYFKRRYTNQPVTSSTDFEILGGTFRVHPKAVIRNTRVPVVDTLRSVPVLQEYIAPKDGKGVVAAENIDYVIDSGTAFSGEMTFRSGTDILDVEGGHFVGRGILPGDVVSIETPITIACERTVVRVLDDEHLLLSRPIPRYELADPVTAKLTFRRGSKGSYLHFYPGTFTAQSPAPDRLWAEMALYDNSDVVEKNFGILVGLSKRDLEKVSRDINYRQAVAGLMFAYTRGSAMNKLRLGAQILLGLPFAEHAGVIRSIENDYRLDAQGRPTMGRILVEDTDASGAPQGTMRVYTFPIDVQSTELSGVETNPKTGRAYAVGDQVDIFAALCKGVEVLDYISDPLSLAGSLPAAAHLQQFHSFRLRANDSIFSLEEMGLVSQFLRRITPSYIAYVVQMATELQDGISITDVLRLAIVNREIGMLADGVGLPLPFALTFDSRSFDGQFQIRWGDGAFWIRDSGTKLKTAADDWDSVAQTCTVSIPGATLLTSTESDAPLARPGDTFFIVDGYDEGVYTITGVQEDQVTVASDHPFHDASNVMYAIGRAMTAEIRTGTATLSQVSVTQDRDGAPCDATTMTMATVETGLLSDGVAIGDWFIATIGGQTYRAVIADMRETDGVGFDTLLFKETLPTGTATYLIVRPQLISVPYDRTADLVSDGVSWTSFSDPELLAMADPKDELVVLQEGKPALFITDPKTLQFVPTLAAGTYQVKLKKTGHSPSAIAFGSTEMAPWDDAFVKLLSTATTTATCTAGSAMVTMDTDTLPLPGDVLEITSGPNAGSYAITQVTEGAVRLSQVMASDDAAASWALIRRAQPPMLDPASISVTTGPLMASGATPERRVDVLVYQDGSIAASTPVNGDGTYTTPL